MNQKFQRPQYEDLQQQSREPDMKLGFLKPS